jgi:hypothetical protein
VLSKNRVKKVQEAALAGERLGAREKAGLGRDPGTDGGGKSAGGSGRSARPATRHAGAANYVGVGRSAPVRCGRIISAGRGPGPMGRPQGVPIGDADRRRVGPGDISRRARAPRGCPWGQTNRSGPGVRPTQSGPGGRTHRSDPSGGTRRPRSRHCHGLGRQRREGDEAWSQHRCQEVRLSVRYTEAQAELFGSPWLLCAVAPAPATG